MTMPPSVEPYSSTTAQPNRVANASASRSLASLPNITASGLFASSGFSCVLRM
jgi:hypothetical protein